MAPRKRARTGEREAAGAETVDGEPMPLFGDMEGVDHLLVYRMEPTEDEGSLGSCEPTITEAGLKEKYGGGKYKITPRDATSRFIPGQGGRTLKIAGDPKFSNDVSRRKWLKNNGIEEGRAAAGGGGDRPPSMMEMMMFMQRQSELTRAEMTAAAAERQREAEANRQQREREAEAHHNRQLELVKLQVQQQEAMLKAERERIREEQKDARERDREFLQALTHAKGGAEGGGLKGTLELLSAAKELFGGGDGESDPLASLAQNAPALMEQVTRMVGGKQQAAAPATPRARNGQAEPFVVEGALGQKASAFFTELARRKIDPAAFLNAMIDQQAKRIAAAEGAGAPAAGNGKAPAAAPAPAPPPAPAASAKSASPKATPRPGRGTTKSALPRRAAGAAR
jgi:hypothetical protein